MHASRKEGEIKTRATRFLLTAASVGCLALVVFLSAGEASASAAIVFSKGPGTAAAPSKLGPYSMDAFAPTGPQNGEVSEVPGPTGAIKFSPEMNFVEYPFADETKGWLFEGTETETLTLPANTGAFYLYAGWGCSNCGGGPGGSPGSVSVTAVAQDGTSSGGVAVPERPNGEYFGFYGECGSSLKTLAFTIKGSSYTPPLAIGAFGIATTSQCAGAASEPHEASSPEEPSPCEGGVGPSSPTMFGIEGESLEPVSMFSAHTAAVPPPVPNGCPVPITKTKTKTDEEKESLELTAQADTFALGTATLGTIATVNSLVPEPFLTKGVAVGTAIGAGVDGILSAGITFYKDAIVQDPFDPRYATVEEPKSPKTPRFKKAGHLAPILTKLASDALAFQADVKVIYTTIDRLNSAEMMGDSTARSQQATALANDFTQMRTSLQAAVTAQGKLATALGKTATTPMRLSQAEIRRFHKRLTQSGLPKSFVQMLHEFGISSSSIAAYTKALETYRVPTTIRLSTLLSSPRLNKSTKRIVAFLKANATAF